MGTLKLCLDAGHFAKCNGNLAVSPVYWESLMAWDLHLMLIEELGKYEGVTVKTTRQDQTKDLPVYTRGQLAKGCDLFISLHSNACESESVDRPVVIYPVSGKCKALAQTFADKIRAVMQTNDKAQIYQRWNSAHNADYYGVIRGAASVGVPGLILEHSFHTNNRAASWLNNKANLRKLAVAEAQVLAAAYGLKAKQTKPTKPTNPFVDVKEGKFYYDSVLWAVENGIAQGVDATHFKPDANMTRGQAVTMLHRFAEYLGKG